MQPSRTFLKISVIVVFALLVMVSLPLRRAEANRNAAPVAHAGAPGEQTCAMSGCHTTYSLNSGPAQLTLDGFPDGGYVIHTAYDFTVTLSQGQNGVNGFQLTALDSTGHQAGTLSVVDANMTQLQISTVVSETRQYITHTNNGAKQSSWKVHWVAPGTGVGTVTFYVAATTTNDNGKATGDYVYTISRPLTAAPITPPTATPVSAASYITGSLAQNEISALFGTSLASATLAADTLPPLLSGVKVQLQDAANRTFDAPLFFVSWAQINFLVPPGLAAGAATLSVVRSDKTIALGSVTIGDTAPGIFAVNANGKGVPAGLALRVKANGAQSNESIAQLNSGGTSYEPLPLDLGSEGEAVFLILYGTGLRNNGGLNNVSCTIGGEDTQVFYAGAQGSFAGLDQINLRIPRTLIGRGNANLIFTANGKQANTVIINVR
jgi:uncharacterized protein (TIGR03437 family)